MEGKIRGSKNTISQDEMLSHSEMTTRETDDLEC